MKYIVFETNLKKDESYDNSTDEYNSFVEALEHFNDWCGHGFIGSCMVIDTESDVIIRQCISTYDAKFYLK